MDCMAVIPHNLAADFLWLLDCQIDVSVRNPGFWNLLTLGDLECPAGVWILLPSLVTVVLQNPPVLAMGLINVATNSLG